MRTVLWRWTKFSTIGLIGLGVQLALLALFVKGFGMHYLLATALSVEAAVAHNFAWHCRWTWADRPMTGASAIAAALLRFHLSNGVVSILGNLLFMYLLVGLLTIDPVMASVLSLLPCALINFLISDRWVFLSARTWETSRAATRTGSELGLC